MKFLVTRNFSSRSMTHYAHNTPNGFSPTVILQPATPTSGGLLSFCGFAREIRRQKMRQKSPTLRRVRRERVSSRAGTFPLKRHSQNETLTTNSRDCHMTPATGSPQCLMFTRLRGLAAEGVFVSTAKNKSE